MTFRLRHLVDYALLAGLAMVLHSPEPLQAQAVTRSAVTFAVAIGPSFRVGNDRNAIEDGYTAVALADFHPAGSTLGVRVEALYARFEAKGSSSVSSASITDLGVNANAVIWLSPMPVTNAWYITGGPSYSRLNLSYSPTPSFSQSENHYGFNVGGGVEVPVGDLGVRLDVRFKHITTYSEPDPYNSIPVTIGIRF